MQLKAISQIESFLNRNSNKNKISLNGVINVNEDLIFDKEVELLPGTKFLIKPKKHIIFKKKVIANGTREQPIVLKDLRTKRSLGEA